MRKRYISLVANDKRKRGKIFVGLSGGVDSAVSAALLKKRGFDVHGIFIKVWYPPWQECSWRNERRDAIRVAASLEIPFHTFDFSEEYKKEVVDYMVDEYKLGRTPNPDVMCNKHVKFGAFFDRAIAMGADMVATGHYARVSGSGTLLAGMDKEKDQSYFLWTLTKEHLAKTIFPVGDLRKGEVRKLAKKFDLPVASKKDSQGVCFIGQIDVKSFLKNFISVKRGDVLSKAGEVIGRHEGAELYTVGERHGFEITKKGTKDAPHYVVSKDIRTNTITVSQSADFENVGKLDFLKLNKVNWIFGKQPDFSKKYKARIRYRQPLQKCILRSLSLELTVRFDEAQRAVTPGQSCVIYDGEECIGGGIIV